MSYQIVRTDDEMDELLNECSECEEMGNSHFPGMSYGNGVIAAIEWLNGNNYSYPINE